MKIRRAKLIFWAEKTGSPATSSTVGEIFEFSPYGNTPVIALLVDEMPDISDMVFRERDGIWYAEKGGFVRYFWHPNDGKNHDGFGGVEYALNTAEGIVRLKGPWASNSTAVNSYGFGPCIEAHICDSKEAFEKGWGFIARAVTIEAIMANLDKFEGLPRTFQFFLGKIGFSYFPLPIKKSWISVKPDRLVELSASPEAALR